MEFFIRKWLQSKRRSREKLIQGMVGSIIMFLQNLPTNSSKLITLEGTKVTGVIPQEPQKQQNFQKKAIWQESS